MFIFSPLEAFKTDVFFDTGHSLLCFFPFIDSIFFTNQLVTILSGLGILFVIFRVIGFGYSNLNVNWNRQVFNFIIFIYYRLVAFYRDFLPVKLRDFFLNFIVLGLFISCFNILGLFPYNAAVTSQLISNLSFTFALILGLLFLGFAAKGEEGFLHHFVPSDVPKLIVPMIFIIEVISFFIRIFSMSIRLFANTVAGHSLLHMLQGLYFVLITSSKTNKLAIVCSFLPAGILYFWLVFEFFVALLQTYVFVLLFLIYLVDIA